MTCGSSTLPFLPTVLFFAVGALPRVSTLRKSPEVLVCSGRWRRNRRFQGRKPARLAHQLAPRSPVVRLASTGTRQWGRQVRGTLGFRSSTHGFKSRRLHPIQAPLESIHFVWPWPHFTQGEVAFSATFRITGLSREPQPIRPVNFCQVYNSHSNVITIGRVMSRAKIDFPAWLPKASSKVTTTDFMT